MTTEKQPIGFRLSWCGGKPEVRRPKNGEWFVNAATMFPFRAGEDEGMVGNRLILDPIYADDTAPAGMVQVPREMIERLRRGHVGYANEGESIADWHTATTDLLAAVPPLAPADPLESEEFRYLFDPTTGDVEHAMSPYRLLEKRRDYIRTLLAEARRAGGAK